MQRNTLVTISDNKVGVSSSHANLADFYEARVLSATDYYAFGMSMKERTFQSESYRYGFNGKENDTDWEVQDYGFRIYKPELGKFLSVDPLTKDYPWYTPYQFAGNKPIWAVDLDGLEEAYKNHVNKLETIIKKINDKTAKNLSFGIYVQAMNSEITLIDNEMEMLKIMEERLTTQIEIMKLKRTHKVIVAAIDVEVDVIGVLRPEVGLARATYTAATGKNPVTQLLAPEQNADEDALGSGLAWTGGAAGFADFGNVLKDYKAGKVFSTPDLKTPLGKGGAGLALVGIGKTIVQAGQAYQEDSEKITTAEQNAKNIRTAIGKKIRSLEIQKDIINTEIGKAQKREREEGKWGQGGNGGGTVTN